MAEGIFVIGGMGCGVCGSAVSFDGGPDDPTDYAKHGLRGHGLSEPVPKGRISEIRAKRRQSRLELAI